MAFLSIIRRWHKREHDRPSKLDPYAEKLSAWLRREENRARKQRRTVKQLYGDLVSLGYDGSYSKRWPEALLHRGG